MKINQFYFYVVLLYYWLWGERWQDQNVAHVCFMIDRSSALTRFFIFFFIVINYIKHIYHFNHFEVHSSMALTRVPLLCSHHHHPSPESFRHPKMKLSTVPIKHEVLILPLVFKAWVRWPYTVIKEQWAHQIDINTIFSILYAFL